jgi:hypothetical protein
MANVLYTLAKQSFMLGHFGLETQNIKVVLIDLAFYTPNFATDQFLSNIPALARVATSPNLTAKTTLGGVFDAADFTFGNVTGLPSEAIVIYQDSGVDATSRLIAYLDTMTGLPITPNGGPISMAWGAYIFQIAGTCP